MNRILDLPPHQLAIVRGVALRLGYPERVVDTVPADALASVAGVAAFLGSRR